jgi:hypothetical protein
VDATIVQPIEAQLVGVDLQGVTVKAKSTGVVAV